MNEPDPPHESQPLELAYDPAEKALSDEVRAAREREQWSNAPHDPLRLRRAVRVGLAFALVLAAVGLLCHLALTSGIEELAPLANFLNEELGLTIHVRADGH